MGLSDKRSNISRDCNVRRYAISYVQVGTAEHREPRHARPLTLVHNSTEYSTMEISKQFQTRLVSLGEGL